MKSILLASSALLLSVGMATAQTTAGPGGLFEAASASNNFASAMRGASEALADDTGVDERAVADSDFLGLGQRAEASNGDGFAEVSPDGFAPVSLAKVAGDPNTNIQDQNGTGNSAAANQIGSANGNIQFQNGIANTALTNQFGAVNVAVSYQRGTANDVDILQVGNLNAAAVAQDGTSNGSVIATYGSNNAAAVAQDGDDNSSTILQGVSAAVVLDNAAAHVQQGDRNEATTIQLSSDNMAAILQNNVNGTTTNSALQIQFGGTLNAAAVVQSNGTTGTGNFSSQSQNGSSNEAAAYQFNP